MEVKKVYKRPELVEYGRAELLTLGASGPNHDFHFGSNGLSISDSCSKAFCVTYS